MKAGDRALIAASGRDRRRRPRRREPVICSAQDSVSGSSWMAMPSGSTAGMLVVDGQRVRSIGATKWKGKFTTIDEVPLGHEVRVDGLRQPDGSRARARDRRARPTAPRSSRTKCSRAPTSWKVSGCEMAPPSKPTAGARRSRSATSRGGAAGRARAASRRRARAAVRRSRQASRLRHREQGVERDGDGQRRLWVFSGIMDDMSDDELAIVVGHEMAHYTHEHSRRQMRKGMWVQMGSVAALAAAEAIDNDGLRALGADRQRARLRRVDERLRARSRRSGGSRRPALRASGWLRRRARPGVWQRFLEKYGDQDRVTNFFFSDHSTRQRARRKNLEQELRFNYRPPA